MKDSPLSIMPEGQLDAADEGAGPRPDRRTWRAKAGAAAGEEMTAREKTTGPPLPPKSDHFLFPDSASSMTMVMGAGPFVTVMVILTGKGMSLAIQSFASLS